MKTQVIKKRLLFLMTIIFVSLASCVSSSENGSQYMSEGSGNIVLTETEVLITQTEPVIVKTPEIQTLTPLIIPTKTLTHTVQPRSTMLSTPILHDSKNLVETLFVNIPDSDDGQKIEYLLETNGGCKFPCLWGFIYPGRTTWDLAKNTIDSFNQDYESEMLDTFYVYKTYILLDSNGYYLGDLHIEGKDNIFTYFYLTDIKQYFSIPKILKDYGKPQEVNLFSTKFTNPNGPFNFQLILIYKEKNFFIRYFDPELAHKGMNDGKVWWEYVPDSFASIYYSPDGIERFLKSDLKNFGWEYFPLSEITGMDVDAFYNHFMSENETLMIEFYPEELQGKLDGE